MSPVTFRFVIFTLSLFAIFSFSAAAQNPTSYILSSPNTHIQLNIQTSERLTYDVLVNGKPVVTQATLSLDIDHTTLGLNPKVISSKTNSVDKQIVCAVPTKQQRFVRLRGLQGIAPGPGKQLCRRSSLE